MHKKLLSNSLWSFAGNALQQLLQFGIFILLARHLYPEQFGYVALAAALIDAACPVVRWGMTHILLQRHRTSSTLLYHVFVLSLGMGALFTTLLIIGALVYRTAVGSSLVTELLLLLAPIIILQALETVPDALVRKRMAFKWLALRSNAAALIGGAAALLSLLWDSGVYALVIQRVVSMLTITVTVWIAARNYGQFYHYRPVRWRLLKRIFQDGAQILSPSLAGVLNPRITDAIIGTFLGAGVLGQFKFAWRICEFIPQLTIVPLVSVAYSLFPTLVRTPDKLYEAYRQMTSLSSLFVFPAFVGLAATAEQWVPLLVGDKWVTAIPPIKIAVILCLSSVTNYYQIPLLLAHKRNRRLGVEGVVRLLSSSSFALIGAAYDLTTLIALLAVNAYLYAAYNIIVNKRLFGWSIKTCLADIAVPAIATAVMYIAIDQCRVYVAALPLVSALLFNVVLGATLYVAVVLVAYRHRLRDLITRAKLLMSTRRGGMENAKPDE